MRRPSRTCSTAKLTSRRRRATASRPSCRPRGTATPGSQSCCSRGARTPTRGTRRSVPLSTVRPIRGITTRWRGCSSTARTCRRQASSVRRRSTALPPPAMSRSCSCCSLTEPTLQRRAPRASHPCTGRRRATTPTWPAASSPQRRPRRRWSGRGPAEARAPWTLPTRRATTTSRTPSATSRAADRGARSGAPPWRRPVQHACTTIRGVLRSTDP
mmetsp:Transcript_3872/g.10288  ORF Transcript_3872/g.10288 Transcript_3872/m.10288 type:complete len:215 (-) Transcript_3872:8-652(-)